MLVLRGPLVQLKDFCKRNFLKETESHDAQIRPRYKSLFAYFYLLKRKFYYKSLSAVISLNI